MLVGSRCQGPGQGSAELAQGQAQVFARADAAEGKGRGWWSVYGTAGSMSSRAAAPRRYGWPAARAARGCHACRGRAYLPYCRTASSKLCLSPRARAAATRCSASFRRTVAWAGQKEGAAASRREAANNRHTAAGPAAAACVAPLRVLPSRPGGGLWMGAAVPASGSARSPRSR